MPLAPPHRCGKVQDLDPVVQIWIVQHPARVEFEELQVPVLLERQFKQLLGRTLSATGVSEYNNRR